MFNFLSFAKKRVVSLRDVIPALHLFVDPLGIMYNSMATALARVMLMTGRSLRTLLLKMN